MVGKPEHASWHLFTFLCQAQARVSGKIGMIMVFELIKKVLPHRYPFLLVDRVISHSKTEIKALKNVSANEPFFQGHFPQMAVMPGVLQVEAMAQAAGLILALDDGFNSKKQMAFLAGVDDARFKKLVVPGDQLILDVKIIAKKSSLVKAEAICTVLNQVVSSATISLVIKPLGELNV